VLAGSLWSVAVHRWSAVVQTRRWLTVIVAAKVEALAEWADRGLVGILVRRGGRVAMAARCFGEHGGHADNVQ
jgi:hypothetical protein